MEAAGRVVGAEGSKTQPALVPGRERYDDQLIQAVIGRVCTQSGNAVMKAIRCARSLPGR